MTKKSETAQKPAVDRYKNLYQIRRAPGRKRWAYATEEESKGYEKHSKPIRLEDINPSSAKEFRRLVPLTEDTDRLEKILQEENCLPEKKEVVTILQVILNKMERMEISNEI